MSEDDIALLEKLTAQKRHVSARRDLIREGDRPGPIFVMLSGWGCRYKMMPDGGRQIMAFMMPGDSCDLHISELAEMDHNIGTLTPAVIATISRDQIDMLLTSRPAIARALWSIQLVDEGTSRAWIVSMGRRDSVQRVAHLMCELYVRSINIGMVLYGQVEMPLTQIVLADALGLTPVHLNRVLRTLREQGAMDIAGRKLVIADPARLARIAGFDENYLHRRLRRAA